jgi:hypothetical protein
MESFDNAGPNNLRQLPGGRILMRYFVIGAVAALLIFIAANVLAAHLLSDCGLRGVLGIAGCADDIRRAGFPLVFWEEGGFAYRSVFSAGALAADIAVAVVVSLAVGWAVQRWWPKK